MSFEFGFGEKNVDFIHAMLDVEKLVCIFLLNWKRIENLSFASMWIKLSWTISGELKQRYVFDFGVSNELWDIYIYCY